MLWFICIRCCCCIPTQTLKKLALPPPLYLSQQAELLLLLLCFFLCLLLPSSPSALALEQIGVKGEKGGLVEVFLGFWRRQRGFGLPLSRSALRSGFGVAFFKKAEYWTTTGLLVRVERVFSSHFFFSFPFKVDSSFERALKLETFYRETFLTMHTIKLGNFPHLDTCTLKNRG